MSARHTGGQLAIGQHVERALAQRLLHHARGLTAEPHGVHAREGLVIAAADLGSHTRHWADEVLDHPVGIGMVHVEPVQLAIGGQVDASPTLNVEDHARGIQTRLLAGQDSQPFRDRV